MQTTDLCLRVSILSDKSKSNKVTLCVQQLPLDTRDFEKDDKDDDFKNCTQYLSHIGSHRSRYLAISVLLVGVSGMRRLKMTTIDIGQHGYMFSIKSFQRYCQYVNNNGRAMPIIVMVMMTLKRRSTAIVNLQHSAGDTTSM